ncbi:MAG: glutamyl-tRNA reductase [Myxococcales bacterium]|nr:glutamyl-tRNA reductase [Myxococcales bacterium]
MELLILGVNHKTAPIEQRERLAFSREQLPEALTALLQDSPLREAVLLNTCNRVEIIAASDSGEGKRALAWLREFLISFHGLRAHDVNPHLYEVHGMGAIKHLFSVASSLDSMVLGEPQILGQVKEAYRLAGEQKTLGPFLEHCFSHGFRTAKRVRTETGIAKAALSISHVAIDLAHRIFGNLSKSTVLLVGAGKMGQQAAQRLKHGGAKDVIVINRNYERAVQLADQHGWQVRAFGDMEFLLPHVDIVVVSTDARHHVLTEKHVENIAPTRRYRPLFIVDISVPRNVDPRAHNVNGVFLYDIDNLEEISAQNRRARALELQRAEAILAEELERFERWSTVQTVQPIIAELVRHAEEIRQGELDRSKKRLGSLNDEQRQAVEQLTRAIVKKMLHNPIRALKENDPGEIEWVSRIFSLNGALHHDHDHDDHEGDS